MSTTSEILNGLGERISDYRVARNLTQAELAAEAGIDRTTISRLEQGKGTLDTLARVLIALGVEERLLEIVPGTQLNPLETKSRRGQQRKRVRKSAEPAQTDHWTWAEDQP